MDNLVVFLGSEFSFGVIFLGLVCTMGTQKERQDQNSGSVLFSKVNGSDISCACKYCSRLQRVLNRFWRMGVCEICGDDSGGEGFLSRCKN